MIASLQPYPEYKESGLPWLGQVPGHWDMRVLKRLCSRSALYGANIPASDYVSTGVRFLRTTDITDDGALRRGGVFVDPNAAQDYMLSDGDLLVSRSGTIGRSLRYRSKIHGPCAYAGYLVRFVPAPLIDADYLFYFTKSAAFADFIRVNAISSTIENVNGDKYANMSLTAPPREEQTAIVRFLDYANGRLERAIRAKRKVIALLNEQKQAIIHRAVTRGLDPTVPLKPSGSRWFPEIPEKWEALSLRRVITAAIDGPHFSPQYYDSGIPFLSARNVKADRWSLDDAKFISEADYKEFCRRVRPEVGDVLYTKGGTTGVARAVDLKFPFQVWVHIAVLKLNRQRITPELLAFCLNSPRCYEQSQLFTRGATNQDLGLGRMKEIELPVPPTLEEQGKIVEALETRLTEFTTAITRLQREIALLREYRTRLVADVATGKLDVREVARQLPEEAAEMEAAPDTEELSEPEPGEIEA